LENQFCSENWARPIATVPVGSQSRPLQLLFEPRPPPAPLFCRPPALRPNYASCRSNRATYLPASTCSTCSRCSCALPCTLIHCCTPSMIRSHLLLSPRLASAPSSPLPHPPSATSSPTGVPRKKSRIETLCTTDWSYHPHRRSSGALSSSDLRRPPPSSFADAAFLSGATSGHRRAPPPPQRPPPELTAAPRPPSWHPPPLLWPAVADSPPSTCFAASHHGEPLRCLCPKSGPPPSWLAPWHLLPRPLAAGRPDSVDESRASGEWGGSPISSQAERTKWARPLSLGWAERHRGHSPLQQ
jgi:hypothetical protein